MTDVDPSSVNVPRELVEALQRELPMFKTHDGLLAAAARALVDAAVCQCVAGPDYDGPREECPIHGGPAPAPVPVSDEAEDRHALEQAADDWQQGQWADVVNGVKHNTTPAYKLGVAQAVTDWLRDRAARLAGKDDERGC